MKKKMESLHSNEVWELVSSPENRKVIESIWIGQPGYASRVLERSLTLIEIYFVARSVLHNHILMCSDIGHIMDVFAL